MFEERDRIVRVGTHTGEGRLPKRLKLHYGGRTRRSVFRRHVGNALVSAGLAEGMPGDAAPFGSNQISSVLEEAVSKRFAQTFSFSVIGIDDKDDRLRLESGLIASLASGPYGVSSEHWLGRHSPVEAIRVSGLWNKNHVDGIPLSLMDFEQIRQSI